EDGIRDDLVTGVQTCALPILYAAPEDLFIFALQSFEGATACEVTLGRAMFSLEGNDYTLFSERPIIGGDQEPRIWVLHVAKYIPSRVGVSWRDGEGSMRAGELHELLARLRVEGSTRSEERRVGKECRSRCTRCKSQNR